MGVYPRFLSGSLIALLLLMPGCVCKPKQHDSEPEAKPVEKLVNLAIWSNYISDEAVAEFTKSTGIELQISNYSSNEELLAKIQAGGGGFDVIVPSDYMVSILKTLGYIQPIEKKRLKNYENIDPRFLGRSYDSINDYSVPYTWTVTGMAINRERFKGAVKGWADVFATKELSGNISLLDDSREVLGIGLRLAGHSINATTPAELENAKQRIVAVKSMVKSFTSEPKDALLAGEIAVAQAYSSDSLQARQKSGGKIEFIFPVEGGTLAIDNLVIPKSALHPEAAHVLIDYLLSLPVGLSQATKIMSGPVLKNVKDKLPPELQKDPTLFPSDEALQHLEMMQDVGDAAGTYDRVWTEIKAM